VLLTAIGGWLSFVVDTFFLSCSALRAESNWDLVRS